jgi:hypothetical protein
MPVSRKPRKKARKATAPVLHECLIPASLFDLGLGSVWISYKLPNGKLMTGNVLLDVFCLGVKNAMASPMSVPQYSIFTAMLPEDHVQADPAELKKLLLDLVAWSRALGFEPHEDYASIAPLLEGIDAAQCTKEFTFGRDGKPFFVAGPNDDAEKCQWVESQLRQSCGENGYDVMLELPDEDEDEEDSKLLLDDPERG